MFENHVPVILVTDCIHLFGTYTQALESSSFRASKVRTAHEPATMGPSESTAHRKGELIATSAS